MKLRKFFVLLTLLLSVLTLFACSNKKGKVKDLRTLKIEYLKNKFPNIKDLALQSKEPSISSTKTKILLNIER